MGARDLVRVPGYGVCAILGDDLAQERKVTDRGLFEYQDQEVGPGMHRFDAGCVATPDGERVALKNGEKYQIFVNPFAPDTLFVRRRMAHDDSAMLGFVAWQVWNSALHASDLIVFGIVYALTGLGITVGFHRLLTHRSFKTSAAVRGFLAALGSAAIEGPVISWVADHRKHHACSDQEGDPHSPHVGHGGGLFDEDVRVPLLVWSPALSSTPTSAGSSSTPSAARSSASPPTCSTTR